MRDLPLVVDDLEWYCRNCDEDLGDFATRAAGDCIECGLILCEDCFDYDERAAETRCAAGVGCRRG